MSTVGLPFGPHTKSYMNLWSSSFFPFFLSLSLACGPKDRNLEGRRRKVTTKDSIKIWWPCGPRGHYISCWKTFLLLFHLLLTRASKMGIKGKKTRNYNGRPRPRGPWKIGSPVTRPYPSLRPFLLGREGYGHWWPIFLWPGHPWSVWRLTGQHGCQSTIFREETARLAGGPTSKPRPWPLWPVFLEYLSFLFPLSSNRGSRVYKKSLGATVRNGKRKKERKITDIGLRFHYLLFVSSFSNFQI